MYDYDFYAVVFDDEVYCDKPDCLPPEATEEAIQPIFAGSEWDSYPVCSNCGTVHDYVTKLGEENDDE